MMSRAKKGFTLIEVISVIAILMLVLVGVSSLVIQNLQAQNLNRNFLIASMLAQEGLELVRNKRDYNWLMMMSDDTWDWKYGEGASTDSDIIQDYHYAIEHTGTIDGSVDSLDDNGAILYLDSDGYYNHTAGAPTIFRRIITIEYEDDDIIELSCRVRWNHRHKNNFYTASTELYNWR